MTGPLADLSNRGVSIWLDDQRPLWASTLVKDPAYPDTRYVTDLVAPGVVNTMPEATLRALADHGRIPADSVRGHYSDARQVLSELEALGARDQRAVSSA